MARLFGLLLLLTACGQDTERPPSEPAAPRESAAPKKSWIVVRGTRSWEMTVPDVLGQVELFIGDRSQPGAEGARSLGSAKPVKRGATVRIGFGYEVVGDTVQLNWSIEPTGGDKLDGSGKLTGHGKLADTYTYAAVPSRGGAPVTAGAWIPLYSVVWHPTGVQPRVRRTPPSPLFDLEIDGKPIKPGAHDLPWVTVHARFVAAR